MFNTVKTSNKPLAEVVAEQISEMIADGSLKAGEKLPNEFALAEKLNVGRGTVREAVKILVSRNILMIRRGYGTYVVEKTGIPDDPYGMEFVEDKAALLTDMFELRQIIEPVMAALAAVRATKSERMSLQMLFSEMKECILKGEDYNDVDVQLHNQIAECSHNYFISQIMPTMQRGIGMIIVSTPPHDMNKVIAQHQRVVTAIQDRDPAEARLAMQDLLDDTARIMKIAQKK